MCSPICFIQNQNAQTAAVVGRVYGLAVGQDVPGSVGRPRNPAAPVVADEVPPTAARPMVGGGGTAAVADIAIGQATAKSFYKAAGWSDARIASHLEGINFSQPVEYVTIPKGTQVVQYQIPGNPTGNYFAPLGTAAESIGVNPAGRVATIYTTTSDISVLRSTAADTSLNSNIPVLARGQGGGIQFFTTNPSVFSTNP